MLYPTGDLAILSAESYDDGRKHMSSGMTKMTLAGLVTVTQESQNRSQPKRRRTSSPDFAGEEEEKKRSRGRPRLEPKDETAQDVSRPLCARSYGDHCRLPLCHIKPCRMFACLSICP